MASLNHVNVVRYYDSFIDDGSLNIIMSYCDRGDLQTLLKRVDPDKKLPEKRIWSLFLQVCAVYHSTS
jgi:serine/threonine protein kinase